MKPILFCITAFLLITGCDLGLTESWPIKEWKVDEYKIVYTKMLGPFGPHYYQYKVYKDNEYLSASARLTNDDTCKLLFREENDYYVEFDLCGKTKEIITAEKLKLDFKSVDSITIRRYSAVSIKRQEGDSAYIFPFYDTLVDESFDSTVTKRLTKKQAKKFTRYLNKSEVFDYKCTGEVYSYLITVYTTSGVRRIKTFHTRITEDELWSFEMPVDKAYFDSLWE